MTELIKYLGPAVAVLVWVALASSVIPMCWANTETVEAETGSKRIQIDDAVKTGMDAIRTAIINNHTLITHRRFPPPIAAGFVSHIKRKVKAIRDDTKLTGESLSALITVLDQIDAGAGKCFSPEGTSRAIEGLADMTAALEIYGAGFDHHGWKAVHEQ